MRKVKGRAERAAGNCRRGGWGLWPLSLAGFVSAGGERCLDYILPLLGGAGYLQGPSGPINHPGRPVAAKIG